ncbi:MAG TPA: hypothetical protein VHD32_09375 [Candidatus Didemnitutus sp.]|nr:hypothetical protein [Candidatus Didemnitutus sp.]
MKSSAALERYYVLPCCLLLLNLLNAVISYKGQVISDGILRTLFVMGMVLFGSSLVALAVAPGITWVVRSMRQTSRSAAGKMGEIVFLCILGFAIFWLYYRTNMYGAGSILPPGWRNGLHH